MRKMTITFPAKHIIFDVVKYGIIEYRQDGSSRQAASKTKGA